MFVIKNTLDTSSTCVDYNIEYIDRPLLKSQIVEPIKINKENHFYMFRGVRVSILMHS